MSDVLKLDMRRLRQLGYLKPGARSSGNLTWSNDGREIGSIGLTVDLMDRDAPHAILTYTANGEHVCERVPMRALPCRFGGFRYYFLCPRTWERCEVLACVGGRFACRKAHRLNYRSQSETPLDRLHRARLKLRDRIDGKSGPKPRGDRRRRMVARWVDLEFATDELFEAEALRRFGALWNRL